MNATLLMLLLAGAPRELSSADNSHPNVKVQLLADVETVKAGDVFRAAVRFRMDPHWHIYWRHPGEAGLPTTVEWEGLNASFTPSPLPAPDIFGQPPANLVTYGYGGELLVLAEVKVPPSSTGSADLVASVAYLACDKECIPGEATLQRSVKIGASTRPAARDVVAAFDAQKARWPLKASNPVTVTITPWPVRALSPFKATLHVRPCENADDPCAHPSMFPSETRAAFIPDALPFASLVTAVSSHASTEAGGIDVELEGRSSSKAPVDGTHLTGVLHLKDGWVEVDAALPDLPAAGVATEPLDAPAPEPADIPLWQVLLLALLGGMILNLMPCVFPVLALKVYAFANVVQEDKRHIILHAAAYVGGIVGSMLALGVTVIGLKAAGHSVGWGFQFQEPLFVSLVGGVLTAFALNLFGVFEVGVDAAGATQVVDASQGLMRSAGEGVLAVLLATPCSAPFLGTAVGFALASPAPVVLAVFATLGVGLAAPFVALVMVPGVARALPRPGPWMMRARQLLGFFLLATVVWLLWVLGQLAGVGGMTSALAFLVCVGLAAWVWGIVQHGGARGRVVGALASALLLVGVGVSTLPRRALPPGQLATPRPGNWLPYDEAAIADTLASGKPVFVDFTADWCLTCKANERMVIARDAVQQAFADHQVVLFKADWTRRDEHIRRVLARHGKAGVPMYLLFSPSRPGQPSVLPEVLTVDGLVADVAAAR